MCNVCVCSCCCCDEPPEPDEIFESGPNDTVVKWIGHVNGKPKWRPICARDLRGINIGQALVILDLLGSSSDPIWYKGEEMTPTDLLEQHFPTGIDYDPIRITYYGGRLKRKNQVYRLIHGTLIGMCRDRARI